MLVWEASLVEGREPGLAPAGEVLVLCFAKEKYPKERRPPVCDPCALLRGKPASGRLRGAPWNSLCAARAARTTTASQFTKPARSDARATPQPSRRRRSQHGVGAAEHPNSQHPFGPSLRSAPPSPAQAPRAAEAGPSAAQRSNGPCGCPSGSLLYAPGARRARGGMRVEARMLRELTHRSCPSGAPQARSEFCGAPRDRAPQVAPQRSEGVADSRVAFSLVTFSWRDNRKLLRRRAHTPASARQPGMRPIREPASALRFREDQPERPVRCKDSESSA